MRSFLRSSPRPGADGHGGVLFTLVRCVPFALALLVLGIELSPAEFLYTGPVLTATPALAAVTMGPKGTLSAAVLALVVSVTTATYNHAWGSQQVYTNFLAILVVSVASVMTRRAIASRRRIELDQVRRIAVAAQEVILRPVPAQLGPVRAASLCLAAETGAQVGGDLYEAVQTRHGVQMIVGDVRGKGLNAMRAVAVALGAFREAVHYEDDPVEVMNHCAAALQREAAVPGAFDQEALMEGFTTALMAQVLPDEPVVRLINRGHPPPLVLHQGRVRALEPTCPLPPFGLEDLIAGPPLKAESYPFLPGDRLLLYTDGVIEARNRDNSFFPLTEAMEGMHATTPQQFLERLHQQLLHHTGGPLADDVAMILVERLSEETEAPANRSAADQSTSGNVGHRRR
ncbi:serine/threonine-protein phosphatase [Streptomyces sp. NBC_01727]|nr:serine/threonine-protein phosphatase [Streptomyces sp. NBC_01727]WSG85637.1 serine/threonine-protein phosphatase [Streptomyces sp. NBC_01727]